MCFWTIGTIGPRPDPASDGLLVREMGVPFEDFCRWIREQLLEPRNRPGFVKAVGIPESAYLD